MRLPKEKKEILNYKLNWNALLKCDLIEKVARPWIGKKIKEYLDVEDQSVVQHIVKLLNQKLDSSQFLIQVKKILDDVAEEFVKKLWQTLIFENMKIDEGLYN